MVEEKDRRGGERRGKTMERGNKNGEEEEE